jgi:hypothetical protein
LKLVLVHATRWFFLLTHIPNICGFRGCRGMSLLCRVLCLNRCNFNNLRMAPSHFCAGRLPASHSLSCDVPHSRGFNAAPREYRQLGCSFCRYRSNKLASARASATRIRCSFRISTDVRYTDVGYIDKRIVAAAIGAHASGIFAEDWMSGNSSERRSSFH